MRLRKFAFAAVAVVAAFFACRDAMVSYSLGKSGTALSLLRTDARVALARLPTLLPGGKGDRRAQQAAIAVAARASLRNEPLDAPAVRQLALADDRVQASVVLARLKLAERVSRRDMLTQLALLERAALESDFAGALAHIDKALTTNPGAGESIYPQLASLVGVPDFSDALRRYAGRPWFPQLLIAAIWANSDDVANLMMQTRTRLSKEGRDVLPAVLARLVDVGGSARARELAEAMGATSEVLDDFRLTPATGDTRLAPLTWRFLTGEAVQTHYSGTKGIEVEVQPDAVALVADRVTQFTPGNYELEQQAGYADTTPSPRLEWQLSCRAGTGPEELLWQQPVPLGSGLIRSRASLRLPAECPVQHWRLRALAEDSQSPASFRIVSLLLRRR